MNKRLLTFFAVVVVSIVGLTLFVENYPLSNFDLYTTREIQEQRAWDPTLLMESISVFGNALGASLSIGITSLFFFLIHRRREALFTLAVIIPDLFTMLMKVLIHRPRPTLDQARIFLNFTQSGFPSGHVVHYVVFFGFLLSVMIVEKTFPTFWRICVGIISTLLILTVSISRIYLGAHWATDVIGGYLCGFAYLGIILEFYLRDPKFKHQMS